MFSVDLQEMIQVNLESCLSHKPHHVGITGVMNDVKEL